MQIYAKGGDVKVKKKLKADSKPLGRPSVKRSKEETILSNGLLLRQWNRIKKECGDESPTKKLRSIVDWYFVQMDEELKCSEANVALEIAAAMDRKSEELEEVSYQKSHKS